MKKKIILILSFVTIFSVMSFAEDDLEEKEEPRIDIEWSYANRLYESKNYKKAFSHYLIAAKKGNKEAMKKVGDMYYEGKGTLKNIKLAEKWWLKSFNMEDEANAMNYLGLLYIEKKDLLKEKEWFKKAADKGNMWAMVNLGSFYEDYTQYRDVKKAKYWYEKGEAAGHPAASACLGNLYNYGEGVETDLEKAVQLYKKSADLGNDFGMVCLGSMYLNGRGVERDVKKAKKLYEKAAELENRDAMESLGDLYIDGDGIPVNKKLAKYWYEKAAEIGNEEAKAKLEKM